MDYHNLQSDSYLHPDVEEVLELSRGQWLGKQEVHHIFTFHEHPTLSLDPLNELIDGLYMYNVWSELDTHEWEPFEDGHIIHTKATREAQPMRYTIAHMVLNPIAEGARTTYERRVYKPQTQFVGYVLAHYRFVGDSEGESGVDTEDSEDPGDDSSDESGDDDGGNEGGNLEAEDNGVDDGDADAYDGEDADDLDDSDNEDAPPSPLCNGHVVIKVMDSNIPVSEAEKHTILRSLGAKVPKTERTMELTITPDFQWDEKMYKSVERLWINVEENDVEKIVKGLCLRAVDVTEKTALDLKLFEKGQIIVSTPEKWDTHSLRWKQRNYAQLVSLFIVDKLHLIGGQVNLVLKVILSRMRDISSQDNNKIRIAAFSIFLANAKDLGEWSRASSHDLFIFRFGVHQIHIQGLHFESRMQVMTKPTYTTILQHAKNKTLAIVFVPTCKDVHLTAVELMVYFHMDSSQSPNFLLGKLEVLEPFVSQIRKETLKETLSVLHEGLSSLDHKIVTQLFEAKRYQVYVINSSLCWGTPLTAHLVVVMGTQYYDGRENSHSDLLQMLGRASRPLLDNAGKCVIFCHTSHKVYYKKFLCEAFPMESHRRHFVHDNFNAEVVAENKQDTRDFLIWTFMYRRRLPQNPNHYSHRNLSDHLSPLLENTLSDHEAIKCIAIEDEILSPLNLAIASYYYISYTTIERFSSLLSSIAKMKGLLEILTLASEYDMIPVTPGKEDLVRRLINHQRFSFENPKCTDPHGERDYAETKPSFSTQHDDKITESDCYLDNTDVVEPDNKPPQKIGDPTNEVTHEKRDDGQSERSKAIEAVFDGNFYEAKEHLTKAIMLNPSSVILYAIKDVVFLNVKKPNAGIRDAHMAVQFNPDSAKGYKARGTTTAMLGQWEEAAADFHVASNLDYDEEMGLTFKKVEPYAKRIKEHGRKNQRLREEKKHQRADHGLLLHQRWQGCEPSCRSL